MERHDRPGGKLGLYVHVPFCRGKCPYCDFYSLAPNEEAVDGYVRRTLELLSQYGRDCHQEVGTVYFGGGTPSIIGAKRLGELLEGVGKSFTVSHDAEITCEANPSGVDGNFFRELHSAGFNRLSMGMQTSCACLAGSTVPMARSGRWSRRGLRALAISPWT